MKTATCKTYRRPERVPYPNAATTREVLHRFLDGVLVAACGMGLAAIVLLGLVL